MGVGGPQVNDQLIVSSFHHTLESQAQILLVVVVVVMTLMFLWPLARTLRESVRSTDTPPTDRAGDGTRFSSQTTRVRAVMWSGEPVARRTLRVGFAVLWLLDGALQLQSQMPLGLPDGVIAPASSGSPAWLRSVVRFGLTAWESHPVQAAAAVTWIQLGIGFWLLLLARGRWSRLGGMVSVAWALSVWVFGESMGGMFAPGASWLFGAPGAVLLYALAGALLALPERSWLTPRLGRSLLAGLGAFFVAMAILQAWPGRGFWSTHDNALSAMAGTMAETPQPHVLSRLLDDFASFSGQHAVFVNSVVVCALGLIGVALLTTRRHVIQAVLVSAVILCMADWVLVQDLGVFGGTGTDPNSAIPTLILLFTGYLGLIRPLAGYPPYPSGDAADRWRLADLGHTRTALALTSAVTMTALGVVPLTVAAAEPNATTLLAQSIDGPATTVPGEMRPPEAHLVDQYGKPMTLGRLHGKVVLMTYLDPVCTSDCPTIAQEFKHADDLLGDEASDVELVAIDANPIYRAPVVLRTFDHQEQLEGLHNWLYLTGQPAQLRRIWSAFEVGVSVPGGGAMVVHALGAAILDQQGRLRWLANFDPGPGTSSTQSSFAVTLADAARQVLSAR
jgi:cytochrome oxidase Cu insertion factor (SCO1/SenC/PrrC family)